MRAEGIGQRPPQFGDPSQVTEVGLRSLASEADHDEPAAREAPRLDPAAAPVATLGVSGLLSADSDVLIPQGNPRLGRREDRARSSHNGNGNGTHAEGHRNGNGNGNGNGHGVFNMGTPH